MKTILGGMIFALCLIALNAIGVDFDNFYKTVIYIFGTIGSLGLVVTLLIGSPSYFRKTYGKLITNSPFNLISTGIIATTLYYIEASGSLRALLMFTIITFTLLLWGLLFKSK